MAERSGDRLNLLMITGAYATVRGVGGSIGEYGALAGEVDRLGIEIGDPTLRMASLSVPAYAHWVLGRSAQSLSIVEEGVALGADDPAVGGGLGLVCPYAWCLMMRGVILSSMGYPDEADSSFERALAAARDNGDVETEGWLHMTSVWLARTTGRQSLRSPTRHRDTRSPSA